MESAMVGAAQAAPVSGVSVQQMPLSFLKEGEAARVVKVRGRGDLQHHLENLGQGGLRRGGRLDRVRQRRAGGHRPPSCRPYHHRSGHGVGPGLI